MLTYVHLTSNGAPRSQQTAGAQPATAVLLTDGRGYRVVGGSGLARGVAERGRRWFRPGGNFEAGDARRALAFLTKAASSLVTVSAPVTVEGDLDEVARRFGRERGEPVLTPRARQPEQNAPAAVGGAQSAAG